MNAQIKRDRISSLNFELGESSVVAKFVDGTKLFRKVKTTNDCEELRRISLN